MRISATIPVIGLALLPSLALAQANPGPQTSPLGGWQKASSNPGTGTGDIPGASVGLPGLPHANNLPKGAYGLDLSRRIADAQKLVDEVSRGRMLTDSDTRHIRDLMREDFIAWNKRFDLLPSAYRKERDRWLVDASALTPNEWAEQRLKWLNVQRDWVLARGG